MIFDNSGFDDASFIYTLNLNESVEVHFCSYRYVVSETVAFQVQFVPTYGDA